MRYNSNKSIVLVGLTLIFIISGLFASKQYTRDVNVSSPTRIGFFHSLAANMLYRTYIYKYFEEEGVDVVMYSKFAGDQEFFAIPENKEQAEKVIYERPLFGQLSGVEIADQIVEGNIDGGTTGATSFVASLHRGIPLVAVAQLGYDEDPRLAIIMRNDVVINSPEDLKGKTLVTRRGGIGDELVFREFLEQIGLVPGKDVTVINQVHEDDMRKWLEEGKVDGGLYHLPAIRSLVSDGIAYVYRPRDWVDPRFSHVLLVFHKDYVESHREEVQKVVNAYVKRIAYERNIPDSEKDRSWNKGLMMEGKFEGLQTSVYDLPPFMRADLLEYRQDLLLKYNKIDQKIDMTKFIDNSFVENSTW